MKLSKTLFLLVLMAGLVVAVGCRNPAEGKTEAEVSEPVETATESAAGETYAFEDSSTITWEGSKVTGSHEGGFNTFDGSITVVDGDATKSSVQVTIDTNSMWSDNERLTEHLKSADFFDVETYPTAEFTSTSIEEAAEGGYTMTGNLTLHGVTKSISFPASIDVMDGHVMASAEFFIKRFDFGIEYKGKADDLIRDEVVIKLDLHANPAA